MYVGIGNAIVTCGFASMVLDRACSRIWWPLCVSVAALSLDSQTMGRPQQVHVLQALAMEVLAHGYGFVTWGSFAHGV